MHVTFLMPQPVEAVSGSYFYDHHMIAALRGAGHKVTLAGLKGRHPVPDDTALTAVAATLAALPAETHPIIDGLCLPAFADHLEAIVARQAVGLVHHPNAIEPGQGEEEQRALCTAERRLFAALPRLIVTSSMTAAQLAQDFAVMPERITVVEPGTADAPRVEGSGGPGCAIVSIATVVPRKGHDVLLRALARLGDLDWTLAIVGSPLRAPEHAAWLRRLADELGIGEQVTFLGELVGQKLAAAWNRADVFALATYWEGYGMAIAEALRRGLPVAVCKGGAAGSLVPPEAGAVVAPGEEAGLSRALRRMICDEPLRRMMAEAAWQTGRLLPTWRAQGERFVAALS